jgi:hypothetical protein
MGERLREMLGRADRKESAEDSERRRGGQRGPPREASEPGRQAEEEGQEEERETLGMKGEAKPKEKSSAQETATLATFAETVKSEPCRERPGREDEPRRWDE